MSKANRCPEIDDHGHRCRRKKGHELMPSKDIRNPQKNLWHMAFDHQWQVKPAEVT